MNKNIFKMIEQLGYKIDYHKFKIYDKNNEELIKRKVNDGVHDGIDFVGKNDELFRFDEGGYAEIIIDSNTNIVIHNIYNEHDCSSISIYLGPSKSYPELSICFDVFKNAKIGGNNSIYVSVYENTVFAEEKNYFINELGIIENKDGASINLFNKTIDHLDIDNCTKENYLNIITNFIDHIGNKNIKKDFKKYYNIIKPVFEPMVDNLVNSRELINNKVKKKSNSK